ncbi:hypothetical protein EVAR_89155_1 [Eumeta japonica]|uniref:Uncharacterized protein n=1 Tax=Eumeta variegata TaxID=151549 RepID=A0A4C1Z750_EUMVA|nr:hypothetical protein EVAR_89155_1 [Eumeta japonica]
MNENPCSPSNAEFQTGIYTYGAKGPVGLARRLRQDSRYTTILFALIMSERNSYTENSFLGRHARPAGRRAQARLDVNHQVNELESRRWSSPPMDARHGLRKDECVAGLLANEIVYKTRHVKSSPIAKPSSTHHIERQQGQQAGRLVTGGERGTSHKSRDVACLNLNY